MIGALSERIANFTDDFSFLSNFNTLKSASKLDLRNNCQNPEQKLSHHEAKLGIELYNVINMLIHFINTITINTPFGVLSNMNKYDLNADFPNKTIVLRIMVSLPVTVASGEQSFSELKLTKNYILTIMGQGGLASL